MLAAGCDDGLDLGNSAASDALNDPNFQAPTCTRCGNVVVSVQSDARAGAAREYTSAVVNFYERQTPPKYSAATRIGPCYLPGTQLMAGSPTMALATGGVVLDTGAQRMTLTEDPMVAGSLMGSQTKVFFDGTQTVDITVNAKQLPAMRTRIGTPPKMQVTSPVVDVDHYSLPVGMDVELRWAGGRPGVIFAVALFDGPGFVPSAQCVFDSAAGKGTIPWGVFTATKLTANAILTAGSEVRDIRDLAGVNVHLDMAYYAVDSSGAVLRVPVQFR